MRTIFLDRNTFPADMDLTPPGAAENWTTHDRTAPDEVIERLAGANVAITNKVPLRRETIEALPDLKLISVAATGYDVVDLEACREHGVTVSNVREYAVNTVPEHTFALILALRRSIIGYHQDVLNGAWQRSEQFCFHTHPIQDLAGSRLGIIGEGAIGQAVAAIARGFGMEPVFAAHKGVDGLGPLYTPFEKVLETADIITLHCPLTPATRDTLAMPEFRAMKRRPLIVNTSRGGLVNEADAVRALQEGLIGGLGFDVLMREPPEAENPIVRAAERPDVVLTPHVAWASREAMTEVWRQTIEAVDAFAADAPVRTLT
ncbi:D-2-hydroxyacid dehydrogenase [uncultured Jannaschia sp.]|uniref:D-2-hydroxyacid dehydrogenase n=1 Tax=uncultured Jannaschia sp. TaxID=293347 RepID=UPI002620660D|nr:D-2-hydroxyacid dehydrogenase [uncultured Jannaschia sp.]